MSRTHCAVCGQSRISTSEKDRLLDANIKLLEAKEEVEKELNKLQREICEDAYKRDSILQALDEDAKVHGYKSPRDVATKRGWHHLYEEPS